MFNILMGVSGSCKTTIGKTMAKQLGWPFYDGDDFHPFSNLEKMSSGIPLSDADRSGWLEGLVAHIRDESNKGEYGVLACSALIEKNRDVLRIDGKNVKFIY